MPNVPNVPGVPPLASYSSSQIGLLTLDTALTVSRALQPQWGIYTQAGQPVIASSVAQLLGLGSIVSTINSISSLITGANVLGNFSVVDFDFKQDWTVADYPVEQGAFLSYDKVQMPFDVRMRVAAGGSLSNRQALLDAAQSIGNSLGLYNVVTPEETYVDCNVEHWEYHRAATRGVGLIIIDIWLKEIRTTSTATFSNTAFGPPAPASLTNTKSPAVAAQQGVGSVTPQSPPTGFSDFAQFGGIN